MESGYENDTVPVSELVTLQDGVLTLHGKNHPKGVIRTVKSFSDYELSFEWRWPDQPGNSGLLLHCDPAIEKAAWPSCLEVQLMNDKAGEFIMMGREVQVDAARHPEKKHRVLRLVNQVEKPAGEWNQMKVQLAQGSIQVFVNGQLVNEGEKVTATSGYIALQLEKANIQFRKFELKQPAMQ